MRRQPGIWTAVGVVVLVLVLVGGDALAKKGGGGKPGGDPGNTTPPDIAYVRSDGLYVVQDDGSGDTQILGGQPRHPTWSPDGTQIAFWDDGAGTGQGPGIYVIDVDGTDLRKVTGTSSDPLWEGSDWYGGLYGVGWCPVAAPDGEYKIAFFDAVYVGGETPTSHLFLVNPDGSGRVNLCREILWNGEAGNPVRLRGRASWAPDGRRLLVMAWSRSGDSSVAVLEFDYDVNGDLILPDDLTTRLDAPYEVGAAGDWASIGDEVVYSCGVGSPVLGDLHVLDLYDLASGAENFTMTTDVEERFPEWSPDDTQVVTAASGQIRIYDVDTGAYRTIVGKKGKPLSVGDPTWRR